MSDAKISFRDRYPGPWRAEPTTGGYKVVDVHGRSLAFVYIERDATKVKSDNLKPEEAKALADAIAGLCN